MIVLCRNVMVTSVLVLFSVLLVYSQAPAQTLVGLPYDVRNLCPGVCPIRRPPASEEGIWWTVLASNTSVGQCGILNNQCPCKCLGYKLCTYYCPPYIPQYNLTSFGFNTERCCYDEQFQDLSLVDRRQAWLVFKVTDKRTGEILITAILDTDNYKSFVVFYACNIRTAKGEPYINVITRDIRGLTLENERRVNAVLRANNLCPEKLIVVNRRNCPPKGQPSINVISRDISGLNPEVERRVDAVLRVNGICPEQLTGILVHILYSD
ncbi:uncharacterized protein LOC124366770 [Homalodisca vitripennis]|uniref:uncharacterized protein LOC124366770 n=1 Tax=Homalodisca vitripennis TaxID=197043 RepID=UPI001EEBC62E|nr:uncharacterized protein LOC124366770 [Homalodisca vitripennis]